MNSIPRIKRQKELQPLSREHHHGLLLCWKIRTGLRKHVEVQRIRDYCTSFFNNQLLPHFEIEEKYLFPLLGKDNELARQGIEQHRELVRLIKIENAAPGDFHRIADLLDEHIRFEERILFNKIQETASAEDLAIVAAIHPEQAPMCAAIEDWEDKFWE